MNIFAKYAGVRPATGGAMLQVPGDFYASVELDVTDLDADTRAQLIAELQNLGLRTNERGNTLEVEGPVTFEYSRGNDNQGRKALWLSATGTIVELISQTLAYTYTSKGWSLSSGRVLREVIARTGGEVRLPDGTMIFIGESEDYASSLLSSDGSYVHPKLSLSAVESDDVIDEDEDPFK